MAENPRSTGNQVYFFTQDLLVSPVQNHVCLPGMFWAWDHEGNHRLTDDEVDMYLGDVGLTSQDLSLSIHCYKSARWEQYHYSLLREVHQRVGFNPDTREVAEFLGYPPINVDTKAPVALNYGMSAFPRSKKSNLINFRPVSWNGRGLGQPL